jgi:hypothetical protein
MINRQADMETEFQQSVYKYFVKSDPEVLLISGKRSISEKREAARLPMKYSFNPNFKNTIKIIFRITLIRMFRNLKEANFLAFLSSLSLIKGIAESASTNRIEAIK